MRNKDDLDSLIIKNRLGSIITRDNSMKFGNGKFKIMGRKLRKKLALKLNPVEMV